MRASGWRASVSPVAGRCFEWGGDLGFQSALAVDRISCRSTAHACQFLLRLPKWHDFEGVDANRVNQ